MCELVFTINENKISTLLTTTTKKFQCVHAKPLYVSLTARYEVIFLRDAFDKMFLFNLHLKVQQRCENIQNAV